MVKVIYLLLTLLISGVIFAWFDINIPFRSEANGYVENATQLTWNIVLTCLFFLLGIVLTVMCEKRISAALRLKLSALLIFAGFFLCSFLIVTIPYSGYYSLLYLAYGLLGGLGTGIAFITILIFILSCYPEKKKITLVIILITFIIGTLITSKLFNFMGNSELIGWKATYIIIAIILAILHLSAAQVVKSKTK